MTSTKNKVILVISLLVVVTVILVSSNYYFNSKLLKEARNGCIENHGKPIMKKDILLLNYSFECKIERID
ncbi:hypothetical protein U8V72_15115 [Priestia filamentosa]|uniref:hypothetical protein n=1 Tax=Priestia filamentosa TaxID=1402861 RepID=UPI00397B3FB7